MAPPISDAVVVDVLRRVDRLVTPLVGRLGRRPERPARGTRAVVGRPRLRRGGRRRRGARASPASWPTCSPCRTRWAPRCSRSSSSGWPPSTTSPRRPNGCPCWPASCSAGTFPPTGSSRCSSAHAGTYREDALGRAGERGPLRTLWRVARLLSRIDDALDARPKGRLHHRFLANLPVVGVLGRLRRRARGAAQGGGRGRRGARGTRQRIGAAIAPSLAGSTDGSTAGSVARFA